MEESSLDVEWNKFIEDQGESIEKEIYESVSDWETVRTCMRLIILLKTDTLDSRTPFTTLYFIL